MVYYGRERKCRNDYIWSISVKKQFQHSKNMENNSETHEIFFVDIYAHLIDKSWKIAKLLENNTKKGGNKQ